MSLKKMTITHQDKRIFIGVILVVLLAVVFMLTLPALVSKSAIEADLKDAFKKVSGLDLEIQDGMEVSFFPTPHVVIRNLYVSNVPGAVASFMLSIRTMDVKLRPTSLFSSHPVAESVVLSDVNIELERLKNGHMNWQALQKAGTTGSSSGGAQDQSSEFSDTVNGATAILSGLAKIPHVSVNGAFIRFTDSQSGVETNYSDIAIELDNNASENKTHFEAKVKTDVMPISLVIDMGNLSDAISTKQTSGKLSLDSSTTRLEYEGNMDLRDKLSLKGKMAFDSKNIGYWLKMISGSSGEDTSGSKPIPLTLAGEVTSDEGKVLMPHLAVGGGILDGELNVAVKVPASIDIKGTIKSFNLDALVDSGVFKPAKTKKAEKKSNDGSLDLAMSSTPKKSMWSYLDIATDVKLENIDYNKNHLKKGLIQFEMSDGEMTISQLSANFPGDAKVLFTGVGKESYQGFMLDGQIDAYGESMVEATSIFKASGGAELLPGEFKKFRIKSNMVLSSQELRFTELTARVEAMAFVGGIITTFGESPKIQMAMRLGGVNIDRWMNFWGVKKFKDNLLAENIGDAKADEDLVDWLKKPGYEIEARLSLEQFTMFDKQLEKSKLRATISKDKLSLSDIEMSLGDSQVNGQILVDVSKLLPFFDVDLSFDAIDLGEYFDTEEFLYEKPAQDSTTTAGSTAKNWSHKGIDLVLFDRLNSVFRVRVGQLKDKNFEVIGFEARGGIADRQLSLSNVSMQIKGAQLTSKGIIKGGKIPSVSMSGELQNQEIVDLAGFMPTLQDISGKFNARFRVNTSGIDVYTWIYNMEGSVTTAARDVTVEGFNLSAIVSAVAYVRTVADILDAVKRAYPGGRTVFNTVDGEWTFGNGKISFPSIKVRNEFSEGDYGGNVDIMNWKMNAALALNLTFLDKAEPPKLSIHYSGKIDSIERELDTRYLERYVANKTSQKLLEQSDQN